METPVEWKGQRLVFLRPFFLLIFFFSSKKRVLVASFLSGRSRSHLLATLVSTVKVFYCPFLLKRKSHRLINLHEWHYWCCEALLFRSKLMFAMMRCRRCVLFYRVYKASMYSQPILKIFFHVSILRVCIVAKRNVQARCKPFICQSDPEFIMTTKVNSGIFVVIRRSTQKKWKIIYHSNGCILFQ